MRKDLEYYLNKIGEIRHDYSSGYVKPHKVSLLLAVIDLITEGVITTNKIYLDDTLKSKFTFWFNQFKKDDDKDNPSQPFFYLESSSFWHHKPVLEYLDEYNKRIQKRKHGSPSIVSRIIQYAYLDDELFELIHKPIAAIAIREALIERISDERVSFKRWALAIGKSGKTIKNYIGAIEGSFQKWLQDEGAEQSNLFDIHTYDEYSAIAEKTKKLEIFQVRDSKGKGMYSAALKLYGEYLKDTSKYEISDDINKVYQDKTLDRTEKEILINTRIGQGQFRRNLINYWGRCAVTGFSDSRFLLASHIKPWRAADNNERLDRFNGILLLPNLDKTFDLGYISFDQKGKILISKELEEFEKLGIGPGMKVEIESNHQPYLKYHREEVFGKRND